MSRTREQTSAKSIQGSNPVMLALSTFRQSEKAVRLAIEKAVKGRMLVVVFIVDINLVRYIAFEEVGMHPNLAEEYEEELLRTYERLARTRVKSILKMAGARGIKTRMRVMTGRFGLECVKIADKIKPALIVVTRSRRPAWVKRFFGLPADHLIANAGCPMIEA